MRKKKGGPKRKKVTVRLVPRKHAGETTEPYLMLDSLVGSYHQHLGKANIAIAWKTGWRPDADGRLRLAQVRKGSELDRELHKYDFVILINKEAWQEGGLDGDQKLAVLDHELCHCQVHLDKNGQPMLDDNKRIVYRLRKHDFEEFLDVLKRHGCYTQRLEELAQVNLVDARQPLFAQKKKSTKKKTPK